ncbi:MAG: transposase [Candidatus Omnitrophica bacterium]|nr:transposase [Candidatus Omnitrophota bacterium]
MSRHTKEFKLEAIRMLNAKEKPVAEIARELGVKRTLLYRWRDEQKAKQDEAFDGKTGPRTKKRSELEQLRKENQSLKEDLAILKKAAAYFARDLK